jgi:hypothetical protein
VCVCVCVCMCVCLSSLGDAEVAKYLHLHFLRHVIVPEKGTFYYALPVLCVAVLVLCRILCNCVVLCHLMCSCVMLRDAMTLCDAVRERTRSRTACHCPCCPSPITVVLRWCYSGAAVVLKWCFSDFKVALWSCLDVLV